MVMMYITVEEKEKDEKGEHDDVGDGVDYGASLAPVSECVMNLTNQQVKPHSGPG